MWRGWVVAGAAGVSLFVAGRGAALAQPPPPRIALRWSAPPECPRAADVVAEVDRILGERGARPTKPLEVSATIDPIGSAYRATSCDFFWISPAHRSGWCARAWKRL